MKKGDFVKVDYIGRLESGEIFDLTDEEVAKREKIYNPNVKYKPVTIILGENFIIKGLDNALLSMKVGEKTTIQIKPEDGFGQRDPKMVKIVPKKFFKNPEPGMVVDAQGLRGRIQSVSSGRVRVDFNNPLAGKNLIYEIEIKEMLDKPDDQINGLIDFFGVENASVKIDGSIVEISSHTLPVPLKENLSNIIIKNVKIGANNVEKVRFVEEFGSKKPHS